MRTLHSIFTRVWEDKVIPEVWHQGIIIPLYKGRGSRSDCSNYRGITLLSVPGKVFAHVILDQIRPTLLAHKAFSAERFHSWSFDMRSHSNSEQHCTTTTRLWSSNLQGGPKKRGHSTFSQISRKLLKTSK